MTSNSICRLSALLLGLLASGAVLAGNTDVPYLSRAPQTLALGLGSGDATFHRLRQDCGTLAGNGASAVYYDTVTISNPNNVEVLLDVRTQPPEGDGTATCDVARDTVMLAYANSFNPAAPMQNCIALNDDAASPNLDRCSRISGLTIAPNNSVVVVVAAYANGDHYPYDLRFDGTTALTDVLFADGFGDAVVPPGPGMLYARHPISGQVMVDNTQVPFPADSWVDAILNDSGFFAGHVKLAPITMSSMGAFGVATVRLQWIDTGMGIGDAPVNGATSLNFSNMELRLQSMSLNDVPLDIGGECRFTPIAWNLTGSSSSTSIDVSDSEFTIPDTADSCAGAQTQLNGLLGGTSNSVIWSLAR